MELPTLDLFFVMARSGIKGMPIPESYVFREGGCQGRFLYDGSSRQISFDANWAEVEDTAQCDGSEEGEAERERRLEAHRRFQIYDRLASKTKLDDVVAVLILPVPVNRRRLAVDYLTASRLRHFLESEVEYDCLVSAFVHPSATSGPGGQGCYSLAQCVYTSPTLFVTEQYTNRHPCAHQSVPVHQRTTTCATSEDVNVSKISPGTEARLQKHSALIAHAFERCGFPEFSTRDRISLYFAISPPVLGAKGAQGRSFGTGGDQSEIGRWILTFASEVPPLPFELRQDMDALMEPVMKATEEPRQDVHQRRSSSRRMDDDVESLDWGDGGVREDVQEAPQDETWEDSNQQHRAPADSTFPRVVLPGRYTSTPSGPSERLISTAPSPVKSTKQSNPSRKALQERHNRQQFMGPWGRGGHRKVRPNPVPWDNSSFEELSRIKDAVLPSDEVVRMAEDPTHLYSESAGPDCYVGIKPLLKDASLQGYVAMPSFLMTVSDERANLDVGKETVKRPTVKGSPDHRSGSRSPDRTQSPARTSTQAALQSSKLFSKYGTSMKRGNQGSRVLTPQQMVSFGMSSTSGSTQVGPGLNSSAGSELFYEQTYRLNRKSLLDRVFDSRQNDRSEQLSFSQAGSGGNGGDDISSIATGEEAEDCASVLSEGRHSTQQQPKQQRWRQQVSSSESEHSHLSRKAVPNDTKKVPAHDLLKVRFNPDALLDHFMDACYAAYDEGSLLAQPTNMAHRADVARAGPQPDDTHTTTTVFIAIPKHQAAELAAWLAVHKVETRVVDGEDGSVGLKVTLPKRQGAISLLKRTLTADKESMVERVENLSDKVVRAILVEINAEAGKKTAFAVVKKRLGASG